MKENGSLVYQMKHWKAVMHQRYRKIDGEAENSVGLHIPLSAAAQLGDPAYVTATITPASDEAA